MSQAEFSGPAHAGVTIGPSAAGLAGWMQMLLARAFAFRQALEDEDRHFGGASAPRTSDTRTDNGYLRDLGMELRS